MIQQISDLFKKHEALILGIGILAVVLFIGNKWLDHRVEVAEAATIQTQAALAQQEEIVAQLTVAVQYAKKNSDLVVTQSASMVAALEKEISSLRTELVAQQELIKTKPVPELVSQWNDLIGIPGVQNTDLGIVVTEPAARATVSQLVEIPVLEKTVTNQRQEIVSKDSALSAQAATISAGADLVSGLKIQLVDQKSACDKQISEVKAKSSVSKRTWFLLGFVSGLGTRLLAHF